MVAEQVVEKHRFGSDILDSRHPTVGDHPDIHIALFRARDLTPFIGEALDWFLREAVYRGLVMPEDNIGTPHILLYLAGELLRAEYDLSHSG